MVRWSDRSRSDERYRLTTVWYGEQITGAARSRRIGVSGGRARFDHAMRTSVLALTLALVFALEAGFALHSTGMVQAQDRLRGAPLHYDAPATAGLVEDVARRLESGEIELVFDAENGYLAALLEAFEISASSQTLVFSKTSFQNAWISPSRPRALYFGDSVYLGTVPGSPIIEVSSMDPEKGPVFYTLAQDQKRAPRLERQHDECLQCHSTSRTRDWPGNLVRSVHPDETGLPILRSGTKLVTHATPFEQRWGGWYVTGTHGDARHRGNAIADAETELIDPEAGANVIDLAPYFNGDRYLTLHSDIVALLVLEHQTEMHNLIARAGYEVRSALHRQVVSNRLFGDPPGSMRDATVRIIDGQARRMLEYMLFETEAPLPAPVRGTTDFTEEFPAHGPRDEEGRSLRDLDLDGWLFRYPCSYLVYSAAFDGLPAELLDVVYRQLWNTLMDAPDTDDGQRLTHADRTAVREILIATKAGLPDYWTQ